jgi:hypothetical protein
MRLQKPFDRRVRDRIPYGVVALISAWLGLPQAAALQLITRLRILRHNRHCDPIVAFGAHRLNRGGTEARVD